MFLVFNKDKICSYLIALSTVVVLFAMGVMINNDVAETSTTNIEENTNNEINILQNNVT
ncbi:MAG: hypothetical protein Q4G05_06370 [Clostridia bacterium]|nr:hypothetical protein [Clostridia bacterium]